MDDLSVNFMALFTGLDRAYGTYAVPKNSVPVEGEKVAGRALTERKPVTIDIWKSHLAGIKGIGIIPITDDATVNWAAIDIDVYPLDIAALEQTLVRLHLPLVVCRSKSGGAHLMLFCSNPISAKLVRAKLTEWAAAIGYPKAEIFPKQNSLANKKDTGNWLNMPYFNVQETARYAIQDGVKLKVREFLQLAESRKVTEDALRAFSIKTLGAEEPKVAPAARDIIEGGRNAYLTKRAGELRRKGFEYPAINAALQEINIEQCKPPLHADEVEGIARSISRYEVQTNLVEGDEISNTFPPPDPISPDEWENARSTPDCIVEDYLFADVGVFISPGGMGKTTLKLFEAIRIVLGLSLYGLKIKNPGPVLIVTAEDSRELLVARLRHIAQEMLLTPQQIALVREKVRISDVSGNGFKLTSVYGDVVMPGAGIELIIEACEILKPVLIVIDPAVSFGVGESRVNDAEQGLVEAARRLRKALNCCVQYIHHTGKQNARDRTLDQYSGRGGSAMADGARMVHVLQSLTPEEWRDETGTALENGETGLRLARPKMSYCAPKGDILIRRNGYRFEHVERIATSKEGRLDAAADKIWQLLTDELVQGRYHSKNTIESLDTGLKRGEIRGALDWLIASQRIESRKIPNVGHGGQRTYLHPLASPPQTATHHENPF